MDNGDMINKENITIFEWIFKGFVFVGTSVSAWFLKSLWENVANTKKDLTKLELHVSEHYEKKETVQRSLERIHGRLDEMGNDIKTLIGRRN